MLFVMICGHIRYQGRGMIPLYRLRAKCDGGCPACNRELSTTPKMIEHQEIIDWWLQVF